MMPRSRMKSLVSHAVSVLNVNIRRRINGKSVRVPLVKGMKVGVSAEPWMTDVLENLLRHQPGAFVDVGMNMGQTLIKVKLSDPARQYVGFEPNPICAFYVNELIKANQYTNCFVISAGLFPKPGILRLDLYSDNETDSSASLIDGYRQNKGVVQRKYVPVIDFDSALEALEIEGRIGIIKVDVEGAEPEVLDSMHDAIRSHRPILLIEILPVYSEENAMRLARQTEIENKIHELDYKRYRILKSEDSRFSGLEEARSVGIHSDLRMCDYVAIPSEHRVRGLIP